MDKDRNTKLRILLLGTPEVYYGEKAIRIQRRSLRVLLFFLACQREAISRARLVDLFWPDLDESEGRKSLREALSKLRGQLPDDRILLAEQDTVRLNPQWVYVDVAEFLTLAAQTRPYLQRPMTLPLPEAIYQQIYHGVNLWRGPSFLPGVEPPDNLDLQDWLSLTTQTLELERQKMLEKLAEHSQLSGDLENAVYWARQALATDPENLTILQNLILWLRSLGRRSEALETCEQVMRMMEGLGMDEVPPSIRDTCERLQREALLPGDVKPVLWHKAFTLQLPFVGRRVILKELSQALMRGGVELIFGEGGSGKSRLVYELFHSLQPAPRLLIAAGRAHETGLPYQPILDMLRQSITVEEWLALEDTWAGALALLLPELPALRPNIPMLDPATHGTLQVYAEAVLRLLRILAGSQRLLFFLEDAHWCDPQTLGLMAYLLDHRLFAEQGLLVIAARPEAPSPALQDFLAHSQVRWQVRRRTLPMLDCDEVNELTRLALGRPGSPELLEQLCQDTGGNPLFLLETLRVLSDSTHDPDQLGMPKILPLASSIHALVRERLNWLSPRARQYLSSAAVAGQTFDASVCRDAAQVSQDDTLAVLEELEQAGLIRPAGPDERHDQYVFIHGNVREVALLELSLARRQAMHVRLAQAMQASGDDLRPLAGEIAAHFEAGGNFTAAFPYWIQAAQFARQSLDVDAASKAFRRAEDLLVKTEHTLTDDAIYQLFVEWADMAYEGFQVERVEACYTNLLRYGEQRYSDLLIGSAYSGLARADGMRRNPELGLKHLERADKHLQKSGNWYELLEAANRRSVFLNLQQHYNDASAAVEAVVSKISGELDLRTRQALANARYQLALTQLLLARFTDALEVAAASLELSQSIPQAGYKARALSMMGAANHYLDNNERALELMKASQAIALPLRSMNLAAYNYAMTATSCLALGKMDEAWEKAAEGQRISEKHKNQVMLVRALAVRGDILRMLGDPEGAVEIYRKGLDASDNHIGSMELLIRLGQTLITSGQVESGLVFVGRALDLTRPANLGMVWLPAAMVQALGWALQGRRAEALQQAEAIAQECERRGWKALHYYYHWIAAEAALAEEPAEAGRHAQIIQEFGAQSRRPWVRMTGLQLEWRSLDGKNAQPVEEKIRRLADEITSQVQHPDLRPLAKKLADRWLVRPQ